ncbi:MAG: shikimate kinase [Promethearchaeota archaeon CR_4]|nr:MAG: shikimate kinase [Candidatus Lokiarchaeota archaeon CR_4]
MTVDNIVLIGFMGTGKSSCGRELAYRLQWEFIEMDKDIERMAGVSIPEIFAQQGEVHFRDLETKVCRSLAQKHHTVISAGGGVIIRPENVQILRSFAFLILLTATPEEIYQRVLYDGTEKRPLLSKPDPMREIKNLLIVREPLYRAAADVQLKTKGKSPGEIASEIIELLRKRENLTC